MDKLIGIYKITSPIGKIYIGQSVNIKERINAYKRTDCKNQLKIFNSLNKYGSKNHNFEIIEECSIEMLNERERYWQDFYDVLGVNGLNCVLTETAEKRRVITDEQRKKIGIAHKGKKISDEQRKRISEINKGKIVSKLTREKISNSHKGKKFSSEHRISLSISKKGKKGKPHTQEHKNNLKFGGNPRARKVIDTCTGKIYNSVIEVSIMLGIPRTTLSAYLNNFRNNKTNFIYFQT